MEQKAERPVVLAIETSCDETAAAVVEEKEKAISVLAAAVASQVDVHRLTGGIVPEAAAREHVGVIRPLIEKVMRHGGKKGRELSAVAVTVGPGLAPALSVGLTAARTLAFIWKKPIIPVNHLEGHVYSALLAGAGKAQSPISNFQFPNDDAFPLLALVVSGGHTVLVEMAGHLQYKVLGSTRDDAAGEAFDKVARLLGLPYPGGSQLSQLARRGDPRAFSFSRPMLRSGDLDFSFSGLKTEVMYTVRGTDSASLKARRADIAAGFQQAVVETLVRKTESALRRSGKKRYRLLLLAGGVAANEALRGGMKAMSGEMNIPLQSAPPALCGDNAIMIGQAAVFAWRQGRLTDWRRLDVSARLSIENPLSNLS